MFGGDSYRIGDGGNINLPGPLDKFKGVGAELTHLNVVNVNIIGFDLINKKI